MSIYAYQNGTLKPLDNSDRVWIGTKAAWTALGDDQPKGCLVAFTDDLIDDINYETIPIKSWGTNFSSSIGSRIRYFPEHKRLCFVEVGGCYSSLTNIAVGTVLFTIDNPTGFSISGWGAAIPLILRNSSNGVICSAIALILNNGNVTLEWKSDMSTIFNEFRILGQNVFSING